MDGLAKGYKFAKLALTGIVAAVLGVMQLATGESQAIVAGSGGLLVSVVVFAFLAWWSYKRLTSDQTVEEPPKVENRSRVFWLGVALTLMPGLLYYYLRYAMPRFDPNAAIALSVPVLLAGLGCIGLSFWLPNEDR